MKNYTLRIQGGHKDTWTDSYWVLKISQAKGRFWKEILALDEASTALKKSYENEHMELEISLKDIKLQIERAKKDTEQQKEELKKIELYREELRICSSKEIEEHEKLRLGFETALRDKKIKFDEQVQLIDHAKKERIETLNAEFKCSNISTTSSMFLVATCELFRLWWQNAISLIYKLIKSSQSLTWGVNATPTMFLMTAKSVKMRKTFNKRNSSEKKILLKWKGKNMIGDITCIHSILPNTEYIPTFSSSTR